MKRSATLVFVAAVLASLLAACGSTVPLAARRAASSGNDLSGTTAAQTGQAGGDSPVTSSPSDAANTAAAGATGSSTQRSSGGAPRKQAVDLSTKTTGPIQIGFVNTAVSNAGALNVKVGADLTSQQIYDALVNEMNKAGGINGRRIQPIYTNTDTGSANWNSDFQAACEKLTRDNKAVAVLGYIFVWLDAFEACLAKAGIVHLYGGYQPGDRQSQRDFPLVVSTTHPDVDSAWLTVVGGAIASGRLTSKNKLGLFVGDCAHGERAFDAVVPAYLRAHKINFETFKSGCVSGSTDTGRAASDVEAAALRFRSDGVDTVAIGDVAAVIFAAHAQSQGWSPSYITSDGGALLEGNAPAAQLKNFHGYGWMPAVDVNPAHQPSPPNATQQRCLSMLAAQGLKPGGPNDYMAAYTTCDSLFMYAAALQRTNGHTDARTVVQALAAIAPMYESASTYNGREQISTVQRGGAATWREWGYNDGCACFVYKGDPHPLSW